MFDEIVFLLKMNRLRRYNLKQYPCIFVPSAIIVTSDRPHNTTPSNDNARSITNDLSEGREISTNIF